MVLQGSASAVATARYRTRHPTCDPHHFRPFQDLWVSSIGLGTYLGETDDATDALLRDAIQTAIASGCNVLDTAINYRCQRSERVIGTTLDELITTGVVAREELLICTKGGYLPFDGAVPADPTRYLLDTLISPGHAPYEEIVAGCHCLSPTYLDHALTTSLKNLRLETIDLYYLHNPEQQLDEVSRDAFRARLEAAMSWCERCAHDGRIRAWGLATWNGLRCNPASQGALSLEQLVRLAERVGGSTHHFRAIQLPYNLAMPEAFSFRNQTVQAEPLTVLEAAARLGLCVVVSASLLQGQLLRLPAKLTTHIPGLSTSAQRALQFVRSTPGVTTALVGMKQRRHLEENLALTTHPLLPAEDVARLFDRRAARPVA